MILYFSGTGNSLYIAKVLSKQLNTSAIHINDIQGDGTKIHDKYIGIICPVYFGDIPDVVRDFLENSHLDRFSYIYAIVTCGGTAGCALKSIQDILQRKKCHLSYAKVVKMPANSTIAFRSPVKYKLHYLSECKNLLTQISQDIKDEKTDIKACKSSLMGSLFHIKPLQKFGYHQFDIAIDNNRCNGCGICTEICPLNNISMDESGTYIGNNCAHCMACVHWCPVAAVTVRNKAVSVDDQYHHPDITLDDVMRR